MDIYYCNLSQNLHSYACCPYLTFLPSSVVTAMIASYALSYFWSHYVRVTDTRRVANTSNSWNDTFWGELPHDHFPVLCLTSQTVSSLNLDPEIRFWLCSSSIKPSFNLCRTFSSKLLRTFVSISTDRLCICFLENYKTTNNLAIIPSTSATPKYSTMPNSAMVFNQKSIQIVGL